jgi:hypothetical protein
VDGAAVRRGGVKGLRRLSHCPWEVKMLVDVPGQSLRLPNACACCLAPPQTSRQIDATHQKKRVVVNVPYCSACVEHQQQRPPAPRPGHAATGPALIIYSFGATGLTLQVLNERYGAVVKSGNRRPGDERALLARLLERGVRRQEATSCLVAEGMEPTAATTLVDAAIRSGRWADFKAGVQTLIFGLVLVAVGAGVCALTVAARSPVIVVGVGPILVGGVMVLIGLVGAIGSVLSRR